MKIGVIVAMQEEMLAIKKYIKDIDEECVLGVTFYKGKIEEINIILVECGIGKVNAARTTQMLIDNYKVDCIINIGVAGGVSSRIKVGDIVIGKYLVQHDFDITAFGHELGYITGVGKEIYSDNRLVEVFDKGLDKLEISAVIGGIASGDIFCTDTSMSVSIQKQFNVDCVEMEGASIAQVCFLSNVPFLILRSISDVVNGTNEIDFDKFLVSSSNVVSKLLYENIERVEKVISSKLV